MTGLEKIISEINNAAIAEANSILEVARAESQKVLDKSNAKTLIKCDLIVNNAKKEAENQLKRSVSNAQLQYNQNKLLVKQSLIKETLDKTKVNILTLSDNDYFNFFGKIAEKITETGNGKIFFSKKDLDRLPVDFLSQFNSGLTIEISNEPIDITGGFVLFFGDIKLNCSIESIFEQYENQISDKISQVLFD